MDRNDVDRNDVDWNAVDWNDFDAVLFDLDGVITATAEVHMRAWDRMFNEYLTAAGVGEPYTVDDYYRYVDGKPRYDGVRSFLASRNMSLPEGTPDDATDKDTVCGLGNRKNALFNRVLHDEGISAFPGSLQLIDRLRETGMPMSIVSSSRNAGEVLHAAGVREYFPVLVDGSVADSGQLAGKPEPDMFVRAADELGVAPQRAVVVEDAAAGVAAGRNGGFGLVIGVDRGAGAQTLKDAGAHRVVADLAELV